MAKLIKGVNDLATVNPELAKQWHPTKNGDLKPTDVTNGCKKTVWWLLPYDDEKTGKHFNFEWEARISSRNDGIGCPYLSNQKVLSGFNDLATTNPELAKEWHPTKNGNLKPTDVCATSGQYAWWYLPYDDIKTGKHFEFEWEAIICSRNQGVGCPYLSNKKILAGFNDLATTNPELAKQWHPTKNGNLKPTQISSGCRKEVWWYLPYNDLKTGKHFVFEWQCAISKQKKYGCPYLSNHKVLSGFNDLATTNPELAKQWHPTKNGNLKPTDFVARSGKKVWWLFPYDDPKTGKHFEFEWETSIANRSKGTECPYLSNRLVFNGFNDLATTNPELAKEWHPTKNGDLKPTDVCATSKQYVWWYLPYDDSVTGKHFEFEWYARINSRNNGVNCPYLSNQKVLSGFNDLATTNPELAKEWHPTKNGNLKPTDVTANSHLKVWWLLPYDDPVTGKHFDYEWRAYIPNRNNGCGCPFLTSPKTIILICDLLNTISIVFNKEKTFQNCKDKLYLPFDIYLPNKNIIIECDGEQHFKPIDHFGGKDSLKLRKKHDNIKNTFCKNNNIPILRIPYIYDPVVDKQKIESLVLDFIQTKIVPQEILGFYSQYKFSNYVECVKKLNKLKKQ